MTTSTPIRVLCVDDNELLATAVEQRIAVEPGMTWVGWVARADNLVDEIKRRKPDIVLLDIDMPGQNAFEFVSELAGAYPQARVIMFSGYVRLEYIDRSIEVGAWGYASKNDGMEQVLAAIEKVADGNFALTPEVMAEQRRKMRSAL